MTSSSSPGSILISLFQHRDELYVFVIRAELEAPYVVSGSLRDERVEQILDELPELLSSPNGMFDLPGWSYLSDLICRPLQPYLREGDRVIFIPHRILHYLPLHLLLLNGAPLVASSAVTYAPSASVLRYCQQRNPKRRDPQFHPVTLSALGLDFEDEADVVAKYFSAPSVVMRSRTPITRELIRSACRTKDVIHFSAHGSFVEGKPEESGLVLPAAGKDARAKQEFFALRDVYELQLDSYLVTLGACSSGLGDYLSGDEVVGMVRGFLYAGTPSVIASLWPVPNEPTVMMMDRLYLYLVRKGLDKAESLRRAQLDVRERFARPSEWAGFTLTGDWL